jgi:hypothetical protein
MQQHYQERDDDEEHEQDQAQSSGLKQFARVAPSFHAVS